RSVLGQRTGRERPPYDPYSARDAVRGATNDNVVTLPGRGGETTQKPVETPEPAERWKGIAEAGSTVAAGLDAVAREDKTFDAKHFAAGARAAYEMIVLAYAEGDRRTLENLLSRDVYEGFEAAIRERETKGEIVETRFVAIDKSDIAGVELRGRTAQITVRFVSQLISVTRDKSGNVIEGNAEKVTDVTDVWTFARDLSSRDPNWKLVAAEAGQYPGRDGMPVRLWVFLGGIAAAALYFSIPACAEPGDGPLKLADTQLEPVKWAAVDGWAADDHLAAFAAFQASCHTLRNAKRPDDDRPIYSALREICLRATAARPANKEAARRFFEDNFRPVQITRLGEAQGFLTGYYEPIVEGSRFPNPEFHVPLYRRPHDLLASGYTPGTGAFPNKGALIGRRNENSEIVPYHDRGAIETGVLDGQKLEICWLRDPFEALAIQIQGSARVILEDGTPLRLNYDSHNGYPYTSVGRVLIERNLVPREEMSMQRIRDWMAANPDEAPNVRATNRSFVFF